MGVRDGLRRRLARFLEVPALRADVAAHGRELAELRDLGDLRAEVRRLTDELAGLRAGATAAEAERAGVHRTLDDHQRVLDGLSARIDGLDPLHAGLAHVTSWLEDHGRALAEAREAVRHHGDWLEGHATALDGLHVRTGEVERATAVAVFTEWLCQVEPAAAPLVSVVLPTRNRAALLPRAVASLRAQRHPRWELVLVDDASEDDTPAVVAAMDDPRIRVVRRTHSTGVSAARNAGLAAATGEVIAYLDDDNTMHPLWLTAVAWAFGTRPDLETVYGGFVVADDAGLPRLALQPYDRTRLLRHNLADMGAMAHRAGLPAARFDESLTRLSDWELLCALTAERDPLVLPAVACFYTTGAPDRLSDRPTYAADLATIHRRHGPPQ